MILFLIIFFSIQALILSCCLAAGNDPLSQKISDEEQMEYLKQWVEHNRT